MFTGIRMAPVMNLLSLLFSISFVYSDQSTIPLKSFKKSENVTYDCIDIYKQPGLDHPLLKTHKIQMKPTISRRPESVNQTTNNKTYMKKIGSCPDGTVPILRNTKEFITNAQFLAEKNFHMLTNDSPGTHIAGVRSRNGPFRGIEAWFGGYQLNVRKDQASYVHIYLGNGLNKEVDYIEAGFMINPGFFPDGRLWTFGFWKGKGGKGCYNTACPGFVQVSQEFPITEGIDLKSGELAKLYLSIHQDQQTGNWWITQIMPKRNVDIGYWPKELFNLLNNGASMVGVGGAVQASPSGASPPMGNGIFPMGGRADSAIIEHVEVLNSNYERHKMDHFPIDRLLDSTNCYDLSIVDRLETIRGYFFNYGGPGGDSCGI